MTRDQFNQLSDAIMLPILQKLAPAEREKLLTSMRQLVHPSAYAWIDAQLEMARKRSRMAQERV